MNKTRFVAIATGIIAVAVLTLFASGKADLFATLHDQGYARANTVLEGLGSYEFSLFHFGPDFFCMVDNDSRIECLGSDDNDIISDAPNMSGFVEVAGGDTYACAYHSRDDFIYCWGSLERSPIPTATTEPTNTPTPTSTPPSPTVTPTPTSTPPPPTVTPTPTGTPVPTATSAPEATASCTIFDPRDPPPETLPYVETGEWVEDCAFLNDFVPEGLEAGKRYYRSVLFSPPLEFDESADMVATLESDDTDTYLLVRDAGGDPIGWNDDISRTNTNSRVEWTQNGGWLVWITMTTYEPETTGTWKLTVDWKK